MTTTFWPRLQRSPITAPGMTWQKCQILVPVADDGAVVDVAGFVGEVVGHGRRRSGHDSGFRYSPLRDPISFTSGSSRTPNRSSTVRCARSIRRADVGGGGAAGVDEVVGVHRRDLRRRRSRTPLSPAASISCPAVRGPPSRFQLGPDGFLNTLPQHGWLNGVPRCRHSNISAICSSSCGLLLGAEPHRRLQHDAAVEPAPAVGERDLAARSSTLSCPVASTTVTRSTTSAQSPPWQPAFMYTPPPTVPGTPTKMCSPANPAAAVLRAASGAGSPAPMVQRSPSWLEPVEALPQPDDQRVEPLVRQQDVGAEPEREPRDAGLVRRREARSPTSSGAGGQQHRGRPADPVGRVPRQRLAFPHLAPDPRPQRRGEARVAGGQPVHSGDISRASACHSCSGRTSPARLRSAMIASQAAEAPDRVVVYGTRCCSAARRMA